jgi:hypothetical protein
MENTRTKIKILKVIPFVLALIVSLSFVSFASAVAPPSTTNYGTGANGSTTVCPASPLTADKNYTTATLTNCTINTNGWRILATTSLTISGGTYSNNGGAGGAAGTTTAGTGAAGKISSTGLQGGTWSGTGSVGGGYAGTAGCAGSGGLAGTPSLPSTTIGTIGAGGKGAAGGVGGAGCTAGAAITTWSNSLPEANLWFFPTNTSAVLGGTGGTNGGGSTIT